MNASAFLLLGSWRNFEGWHLLSTLFVDAGFGNGLRPTDNSSFLEGRSPIPLSKSEAFHRAQPVLKSRRAEPVPEGRSPFSNLASLSEAHKKAETIWPPLNMRTLVIALLLSKFLFDTSRLTRTLT